MRSFIKTDSDNKDFQKLVTLLDADLAIRDGDDHAFYSQFNKIDKLRNVIVCFNGNEPVGCGAFKVYDATTVEIKRMFVQPHLRSKGLGAELLKELESWAAELHYTSCILETGKMQPEAIALYKKCGYEITKNYGQYEDVENSVCMKKFI